MMKLTIRLLFIIVLSQILTCDALGGYGRGSSKYGGGKDSGKAKTYVGTSTNIPAQNTVKRSVGLSAWGIVFLVVALVVGGMGFYYFSMCYPYFCQRQEKYHMMGTPTMA